MTFNSVSFFAFFPLAVLVCWLVPRRWQNAALLAVSYAFYCFNTPAWLPVLVLDSLATWALVRRMDAAEGLSRKRRLWAALGVNLGLLVLLKGASLLLHGAAVSAGLWQALSRLGLASEAGGSAFSVILPLGISFFTVQSVGYAVDVYRKKYAAEPSACNFALFVSFFPLISSGPIMRGDKLLPQLRAPRALRTDRAAHALVTFALGLFSKVAVADLLAVFANAVYGDVTAYTGLTLTFGALCYGLQLYFDFSGYSLMALGAAELLGLQLTTNFDTPYFSRSIREFWGRWHISFSSWLKDYVYIPLGGNRKGLKRQIFNLFVVELLTGIWHGANWNFICWGLYYFVLLAIENLFLLQYLQKGKVWPHIYTLFLEVVGWAMFVGNEAGVGFGLLFRKLFLPSGGASPVYFLRNYGVLLAVSILCCTPLIEKLWNALRKHTVTRVAAVLVLLVLSTAYVVGSTNSPFLYFNF